MILWRIEGQPRHYIGFVRELHAPPPAGSQISYCQLWARLLWTVMRAYPRRSISIRPPGSDTADPTPRAERDRKDARLSSREPNGVARRLRPRGRGRMGFYPASGEPADFADRSMLPVFPTTLPPNTQDAQRVISQPSFASHGAGLPLDNGDSPGARARGVILYGHEKNVGGCHPPGRNTDRRYRR